MELLNIKILLYVFINKKYIYIWNNEKNNDDLLLPDNWHFF